MMFDKGKLLNLISLSRYTDPLAALAAPVPPPETSLAPFLAEAEGYARRSKA